MSERRRLRGELMGQELWVGEVLEAEARRRAALVGIDMAALDRLFAEDLVHIHSNGLVHDKPALMRHIEIRKAFVAIERHDLKVRLFGEVAVLTGRMVNTMRGPVAGQILELRGVASQVLRRTPEGWRFHHFQFTLEQVN